MNIADSYFPKDIVRLEGHWFDIKQWFLNLKAKERPQQSKEEFGILIAET